MHVPHLALYGSEAQKQRFLPGMAKGKLIGCFGLTEPDFGSDPGGLRTRARKDGDGYVLNGSKMWITNGTIADVALVWAKVDDGGHESMRGFLVEKGMPGFSAKEIEGKFSLRASYTAELAFVDVRVPAANMLPGVQGMKGPLSCLNKARMGIAFGVMGAAVACFEGAREYALTRKQFGKPIAGFQLTQEKLADMLQEIVKGQLLALQLGAAGRPARQGEPGAGVAGQAQQRQGGARDRPGGAQHLRRQRHHRRVPAGAAHAQPRERLHLRGHPRGAHADPRQGHHRPRRLRRLKPFAMAYTRRLPIRFADVDFARVVYFPRFFDYCHSVMEDFFLDEVGVPYAQMLGARRVGFPTVHAEADFKSPFRFGEEARVLMTATRVGTGSAGLRFQLYRGESDVLCAVLQTVVAAIDMDTFSGVPLPDDVRAALGRHLVP